MIFDRTQTDIDTALTLIARLQRGEALTDEEIAKVERGTLTINTLNRIESTCADLKTLLANIGYYSGEQTTKQWQYSEYFKQRDFDRIAENVLALKNAFFAYATTPKAVESNYLKYQTINDVEHILNDLYLMIDDVKSYFRQCGTFECGEVEP